MSEAKERVLDQAERLFLEHGFAAVTMHDIAEALGMRQASLYYHAPGGKEELFVSVMERTLARHRVGLTECAATADDRAIELSLQCASRWFLSQPPLDLLRVLRSDITHISEEQAERLSGLLHDSLIKPLCECFDAAAAREEIRDVDPNLMAGAFLSFMGAVWYARHILDDTADQEHLARQLIDVLIHGLARTS